MSSGIAQKKQIRPWDFRSFVHNTIDIDWDKSIAGRQHEAIMVIDTDCKLVYASDGLASWLETGPDNARGLSYQLVMEKVLHNRHSVLVDTLETGVNYESVLETVKIDNRVMTIEYSTMLLVNDSGSKIGALLYLHDVTARVTGLKQMQQYETMRTVNNFAASMSHHLKNPLTAVAGFLQLIKDQDEEGASSQYCDWALEELDRIRDILERISLLAMPSEGQELITLARLMQGVKRTLQTTARTMQVKVQIDDNPPAVIIKGHYEQLREAIMCLVHNGMEATEAGGNLTMSSHYHRSLAMVEIRIVDEGLGCTNLETIFQPFFSRSVDRTGLGLNIAEHIAMVHRGYIRLLPNQTGSGTVASFFLPAAVNISGEAAGISIN